MHTVDTFHNVSVEINRIPHQFDPLPSSPSSLGVISALHVLRVQALLYAVTAVILDEVLVWHLKINTSKSYSVIDLIFIHMDMLAVTLTLLID